jgi:hypothetical protein
MKSKLSVLIVAILFSSNSAALAGGALPSPRRVSYSVFRTSEPASELIWTIELDIHAVERSDNDVTWSVDQVHITYHINNPRIWVDTPASNWIVEHADADNVCEADFAQSPEFSGVAEPVSPKKQALEYSFQSSPVNGGGHARMINLALLQYWLRLQGESQPVDEADSRPVDLTIYVLEK